MNLWVRIKNLYKLSEYQAGKPTDEYKEPGTQIITLTKKPDQTKQEAKFFPRIRITAAEKIINEPTEV